MTRILVKTAGTCAMLLAGQGIAPCALAQSAGQTVEVTGTHLRGVAAEGSSPVQVLSQEDIQRTGATSLRELLDTVSASAGSTSDLGGSASFAAGASGASLRNLGRQATLILLNSRRVAPYPLADYAEVFTNIDALPFEAVERIEILKGGASAIYGSDAVAGVINVITRQDWVGLQARASRQQSMTSGRFGTTTASLTGGIGEGGGDAPHALLNLEVYRREGVMWSDVLKYANPEVTQLSPSFGSASTYSWPGNLIGAGPIAGCTTVVSGLCRYDRYSRFEARPAAERANLLLNAQQGLGSGMRLFGEALLARTQTTYRSAYQPYGSALGSYTWGNPTTNEPQTFWFRGLPASHPLNTSGRDDAEFRYRFVDGPADSKATTTQYRVLAGLDGHAGTVDWESAAGVMGGRTQFDQRGWWSLSGFHEVIGNDDPNQVDPLFFNRAYRIGQTNTPAVIDRLFPSYGYTGDLRQAFLDGKLTTTLARWDTRPVALALGAEARHESHTIDPSAELRSGDIVGNGLSASAASRWVLSSYAELSLPVAAAVDVQAAARWDKYGGTAAHLSPRLGLQFRAAQGVLLRASAESGFRAPNLTESAESTKFAFDNGVPDPLRCPQAEALARDLSAAAAVLPAGDPQATLLQARADNVLGNECTASVASIVRHNPDLKPEISRSYGLGVVLEPAVGWKLAVDAWSIHRRDEIGLPTTSELLADESTRPAGTVNRAPLDSDTTFTAAERARYGVSAGKLVSTVGRFANTSRTEVSGVDVAGSGRFDTPMGVAEMQLDAAYLGNIRYWSATRDGWGDNRAGRGGFPRWRVTSGFTLKAGPTAHTLQAVSTSGTTLQGDYSDTTYEPAACVAQGFTAAQCRVAGWTRWDYAFNWKVDKALSVSMHLYNALRKRVPVGVAGWLNGGGILPPTDEDAKGRMLRLTLEWRV